MKGKLTLNRLMNNSKLVLVFSIVVSISIWAVVNYVVAADTDEPISATATLDLSSSVYGSLLNMEIFGQNQFNVTVMVKGGRWGVKALDDNDIRLVYDYDSISSPVAGKYPIGISAVRNNNDTVFEIIGVYPSEVEVYCSRKAEQSFPLELLAEDVTAKSGSGYQIGTPVLHNNINETNTVTVSGPVGQVSKIKRLITKVQQPKAIDQLENFTADIVALDIDDNPVDLNYCTFTDLSKRPIDSVVSLQVPVLLSRTVTLKYSILNVPEGLQSKKNFITLNPPSLTISGEPGLVEEAENTMGELGEFDLRSAGLGNRQFVCDIAVPQGISVVDDHKTVSIELNMDGFTEKTFNIPVSLDKNVVLLNRPDGKTVTMSNTVINNITLVGNSRSITRIKESDLKVTVDMAGSSASGSYNYSGIISVEGYNDVWVCFPAGDNKHTTINLTTG